MRSNAIPGSRFRGLLSLFALACGAALITASPGCGGGGSSLPKDGGAGGTTGTGGKISGFGGSPPGTGGSGMGGSGMGGSGMGGAMDAGPDAKVCPDGGSAADSDGDGIADCLDGFPNDVSKTAPGACGCGITDIDSDGDGVADCVDACPANKDLTAMGVCGCNTPVDTDHDGTPDCTDACPFDATRTTPGACGCGIHENTPLCLVHRYSFNDTTSTIADSITIPNVSPKNGMGSTATVVPSGGKLTLAGGASNVLNGQWVTLPAGTISSLGPSATFEAWVAWTSPLVSMWQRIFDFGNSDQTTPMTPGQGVTYIFLTPYGGSNVVRAAITLGGGGASEDVSNANGQLSNSTTPTFFHLAVVVDDANLRMTLYVNGQQNGSIPTLRAHNILSQVKDDNNWLGRSQWAPDPLFQGVYD